MCVSHGIRLPFEYIAKIQNKFHITKYFCTFFQVFLEIFFSAQITHPYPAIRGFYCAIRAGYWRLTKGYFSLTTHMEIPLLLIWLKPLADNTLPIVI